MKRLKESDLKSFVVTHNQNSRLCWYRSHLRSDSNDVLFDSQQRRLIEQYCLDSRFVQQTLDYLNNLTDGQGRPFCRSIGSYSEFIELLDKFQLPGVPDFSWNKTFRQALQKVAARYATARATISKPHSNEDCLSLFAKLNTSAGWEYINSGCRHKGDFDANKIYPTFRERTGKAMEEGSFNNPSLLSNRFQCSGEFDDLGMPTFTCNHKTRPVWMSDMFNVLCENQWGNPATEFLRGYNHSSACKPDMYTWNRISQMRRRWTNWTSLDYSQFDATLQDWLLHASFYVLSCVFPTMTVDDRRLLSVNEEPG